MEQNTFLIRRKQQLQTTQEVISDHSKVLSKSRGERVAGKRHVRKFL